MATSFDDPKVTNAIAYDIPQIKSLLHVLAKQDYTDVSNIPEMSKRIVELNPGYQLQKYTNSSWVTVGKLMHDVDQLDGYHASITAVKKTIPVYNDNAQLPGDITGNAATSTKLKTARTIDVGGIASATEQKFDGSSDISILINSINVENAEDNALVGVVSKAHGGTGRTDGAATDVILSNGGKASEYGQIGEAKNITGVDIDTLIEPGDYISAGISVENHWPYTQSTTYGRLKVSRISGNRIIQILFCGTETIWQRLSINGGASWSALLPSGGSRGSSLTIYISKSGNDLNTGTDSAHPVLTINRALKIAEGWKPTQSSTAVIFRIGEGNWGSLTLSNLPMALYIEDYSGDTSGVYSSSFPVFDSIVSKNSYTVVRNVHCYRMVSEANGYMSIERYIRTGCLQALYAGYMAVSTTKLDIVNRDNNSFVFSSDYNGCLAVATSSGVDIIENISVASAFLSISHNSIIMINKKNPFTLSEGVSVTGRKYQLSRTTELWLYDDDTLNEIPGTTVGVINVGARINGIPYGGGDSDAALMGDRTWKPVLLQSGGVIKGPIASTATTLIKTSNWKGVSISDTSRTLSSTKMLAEAIDKDGKRVFGLEVSANTDGSRYCHIVGRKRSDDGWFFGLRVIELIDGSYYATCGTPPSSAAGDEIATTAWVRKTLYKGATASAAGTAGLVPAAAKGENNLFLRGDGSWAAVGLPLGHMFAWPFTTPPDGSIVANGTTYSRTTYKDLWNYISSNASWVKTESEWQSFASSHGGYCPYYSSGNGSSTFRTPKFAPFQQITNTTSSSGTYHEAGLPNITGEYGDARNYPYPESSIIGAFTKTVGYGSGGGTGWSSDGTHGYVRFDASDSNQIYGKSNTVQPESNEWIICIVAIGSVTNIGSVDLADVVKDIETVQRDLSALPKSINGITPDSSGNISITSVDSSHILKGVVREYHDGGSWTLPNYGSWHWIMVSNYNDGNSRGGTSAGGTKLTVDIARANCLAIRYE